MNFAHVIARHIVVGSKTHISGERPREAQLGGHTIVAAARDRGSQSRRNDAGPPEHGDERVLPPPQGAPRQQDQASVFDDVIAKQVSIEHHSKATRQSHHLYIPGCELRRAPPHSPHIMADAPPPPPMRRVCMGGGAGFIGSHLTKRLMSEGWHVVCAEWKENELMAKEEFCNSRDDGELNTNPPTSCQIGKRPPAPKPKRESAGHQGVAGGGYKSSATAQDMEHFRRLNETLYVGSCGFRSVSLI